MPADAAIATKSAQKAQRELEDLQLVVKARNGSDAALDALMRRYTGFVRLKASSYFLAGGDSEDLIQEGLVGLYKAVRDFRADKETSFRSFAELCVTRQIITAIKTATTVQAPAPEPVRVVLAHAGRAGQRRVHARRRAAGPVDERPGGLRDLDRGAAEPRLLPRHRPLAVSRPTLSAATSRVSRTSRWPRSSAATARRSTTPCSGSSARSSRTRRRAKSSPDAKYDVPASPE